jgi:predicted ATPase/transcriptional regulator with XRE-family HTH domain
VPQNPDDGPNGPASSFAELLRSCRRHAGLTQQELADRAGLGVRTVRELERGRATRPQRNTVDLLCDALGLAGERRAEFVAAARGIGGARNGANSDLEDAPAADPGAALATLALPPAPALVGRSTEVRDVAGLFDVVDVVTLVGLAGVGKSCLALAVVHRIAGRFPGGTAGVLVSEVSSSADVLAAVASVFGVAQAVDLPQRCGTQASLLLVDGADRAPTAAAEAVRWLRSQAPALRVLITSRHPIDVPGAVHWPLAVLDVPPCDGPCNLDTISGYPAVALFLQRLRRVRGEPVRPEEAPVLARLVRRLGGLPLALELAAARSRVLSLAEILERYGDRVLDLSARAPGETLRDAVSASYRLLADVESAALRRLAVFCGRWSIELAEGLLSDGDGPARYDVEAVLDRLVELGLVSVRPTGDLRFLLLDMVREFALEQCAAAGELPAVKARHAMVFAALAERTGPQLAGPTLPAAISRLDHLASDLRAAMETAAASDPHTALRLAGALPRWWRFRGRDREGRQRLRALLADPRNADADPAVRAWAQLGAAMLAAEHGEAPNELPAAEAALTTFVERADVAGELAARGSLCVLLQAVGDHDGSRRHGEALLELAVRTGRVRETVVAQNNLTWHDIRVGDLTGATRRLTKVARMAARAGDARLRAVAHANLAEVARLDGRYGHAVESGRRAVRMLAELGDPGHRVRVLGTVGMALAQCGRVDEAVAVLAQLPASVPAAAGARAMIGGYLALGRGDRAVAVQLFLAAAEALQGHHDARDVVEALVGAAASTDDPDERDAVLTRLTQACRQGAVTLLPAEVSLLRGQAPDRSVPAARA